MRLRISAELGVTRLPKSRAVPAVGFCSPSSSFTRVVLPAPFGPSRREYPSLFDGEVDSVDGDHFVAVDLGQIVCLEQRHLSCEPISTASFACSIMSQPIRLLYIATDVIDVFL